MADLPQEQSQQQDCQDSSSSKNALKKAEKAAKMAAAKAEKAAKQTTVAVVGGKKDKELIGITTSKNVDFSAWYLEVVTKAGMIEYYNEVRAH